MSEQKIICKDCGREFIFTEGEQKFFASKGFPAPVRCPTCRKNKKNSYANTKINSKKKKET